MRMSSDLSELYLKEEQIVKTCEYLKYIVDKIHTVILATADDKGHPFTSAVDMMHTENEKLYFLTAKGKNLYSRLKNNEHIALTGLKGESTLTSISISIRGKAREIGSDMIPFLFDRNPYIYEIYPNEESRKALTVFEIYEGNGEFFDLSKKPIERESFIFGKEEKEETGYFITDACIGCGCCLEVCPQKCILCETIPFVIKQKHCLACGNCFNTCPHQAVIRR